MNRAKLPGRANSKEAGEKSTGILRKWTKKKTTKKDEKNKSPKTGRKEEKGRKKKKSIRFSFENEELTFVDKSGEEETIFQNLLSDLIKTEEPVSETKEKEVGMASMGNYAVLEISSGGVSVFASNPLKLKAPEVALDSEQYYILFEGKKIVGLSVATLDFKQMLTPQCGLESSGAIIRFCTVNQELKKCAFSLVSYFSDDIKDLVPPPKLSDVMGL